MAKFSEREKDKDDRRIQYRMLLTEALAEVRGNNIESSYTGGVWDKPHHHRCDLCNAEWPPGQPEVHNETCLIGRMTEALGLQVPVTAIRALGRG